MLELNNSAQNQTHRLNVLFGYRTWESLTQSSRRTPVDIPRTRRFPNVPVVDTRTRQFSAPTGELEYDIPGSDLPISA